MAGAEASGSERTASPLGRGPRGAVSRTGADRDHRTRRLPRPLLCDGAGRSLVAHSLWEREVVGSNPTAPITRKTAISRQLPAPESRHRLICRLVRDEGRAQWREDRRGADRQTVLAPRYSRLADTRHDRMACLDTLDES